MFYYLHGLGGNETNWTKNGELDAAADQLGLAAIVVMPDGDDGFYVDSAFKIDYDQCMKDGTGLFMPAQQPHDATCVRARNYETYIAKDLVGWVDGHYRTIARRDGIAPQAPDGVRWVGGLDPQTAKEAWLRRAYEANL